MNNDCQETLFHLPPPNISNASWDGSVCIITGHTTFIYPRSPSVIRLFILICGLTNILWRRGWQQGGVVVTKMSTRVGFSFAVFLSITGYGRWKQWKDKMILFHSLLRLLWELVHKIFRKQTEFYHHHSAPISAPMGEGRFFFFFTSDQLSSVGNKLPKYLCLFK